MIAGLILGAVIMGAIWAALALAERARELDSITERAER